MNEGRKHKSMSVLVRTQLLGGLEFLSQLLFGAILKRIKVEAFHHA